MPWTYPIFVDLAGKTCLIAGYGHECVEKMLGLVEAGARVIWVSPQGPEEARILAETGRVEWRQRDFLPQDLEGCFLVVATGPDRSANARIFAEAEARNILVNCLDDPPHCRFAFASTLKRGDLVVAIFTNGKSPALGVRLKQRFEQDLGPEYGEFLELAGEFRNEITRRIPPFPARRDLWYRLVDSAALEQLKAGSPDRARRTFRELIDQAATDFAAAGEPHVHSHHS